jgi:hypothetical protein
MEQVADQGNLNVAWQRVRQNGGAPGIDGITVEVFPGLLRPRRETLRQQLLDGSYRPSALRRVTIPKPNGGERQLGIPTVQDRLVQQALLQVLQPILDPTFHAHSYGFRPNKSAHQAVAAAQAYSREGCDWVVDLDWEAFFDHVNHDRLMSRLGERMADKRVRWIIRRFLQAGVLAKGVLTPTREGTPQGGPLTPWTHLVILSIRLLFGVRCRCGWRRRSSGRRYGRRAGVVTAAARQRDAVAHGDRVLFHHDFFHEQADDFLFFSDAKIFGRLLQPPQKTFQRLIELLELRLGQRLPVRAFQLLLCGGLFFAQPRQPLAQLCQSVRAAA